jgi:hypothetical protein
MSAHLHSASGEPSGRTKRAVTAAFAALLLTSCTVYLGWRSVQLISGGDVQVYPHPPATPAATAATPAPIAAGPTTASTTVPPPDPGRPFVPVDASRPRAASADAEIHAPSAGATGAPPPVQSGPSPPSTAPPATALPHSPPTSVFAGDGDPTPTSVFAGDGQ